MDGVGGGINFCWSIPGVSLEVCNRKKLQSKPLLRVSLSPHHARFAEAAVPESGLYKMVDWIVKTTSQLGANIFRALLTRGLWDFHSCPVAAPPSTTPPLPELPPPHSQKSQAEAVTVGAFSGQLPVESRKQFDMGIRQRGASLSAAEHPGTSPRSSLPSPRRYFTVHPTR